MGFAERIASLGETKAKATATAGGIIPAWLSFVFCLLFVSGCVSGGCSLEAGFRNCIDTVRDACAPAAPSEGR